MKLEFNKKSIISFIPFVLLAVLFWASTILSRQNTYSKDIWMELIPPSDMVLLDSSLIKANLTLVGEGFYLLFISSFNSKHPIKIHLDQDDKVLSKEKVLMHLKEKIDVNNIKIADIVFKHKQIYKEKKVTKKIAIYLNSEIEFDNNFGLKSPVQITPNFIDITGPKSMVDTIQVWNTEKLIRKKTNKTLHEIVKLKSPNNYTTFNVKEVKVGIPVESYTEKRLSVPIQIDGPGKNKYEIIPTKTEVSILVGLSKYDYLHPDDFSASVYLGDNIVQNEKLPVSIVKKPGYVSIRKLNPDFVDVLPKISN